MSLTSSQRNILNKCILGGLNGWRFEDNDDPTRMNPDHMKIALRQDPSPVEEGLITLRDGIYVLTPKGAEAYKAYHTRRYEAFIRTAIWDETQRYRTNIDEAERQAALS